MNLVIAWLAALDVQTPSTTAWLMLVREKEKILGHVDDVQYTSNLLNILLGNFVFTASGFDC